MQSYEFLKAWRERSRALRVPTAVITADAAALEAALQAGDPLVSVVPPELPEVMFGEVLAELRALLEQYGGNFDEDTLKGLAIQPFMAAHAANLADVAPLALWRQNYCPICGTDADVCRIDADNLRHLHCPTCDTQWEHYRLSCTTCGTDDIKQVNLLTLETLEPWRAEVCNACGGYIKTLDQRHGGLLAMPKVDLFLEDARTLQLDLLAEQEGYRRGGRVQ